MYISGIGRTKVGQTQFWRTGPVCSGSSLPNEHQEFRMLARWRGNEQVAVVRGFGAVYKTSFAQCLDQALGLHSFKPLSSSDGTGDSKLYGEETLTSVSVTIVRAIVFVVFLAGLVTGVARLGVNHQTHQTSLALILASGVMIASWRCLRRLNSAAAFDRSAGRPLFWALTEGFLPQNHPFGFGPWGSAMHCCSWRESKYLQGVRMCSTRRIGMITLF